MALIRDSRLDPYEIAALGAGGMGEVYRTSDNAEAITQISITADSKKARVALSR